METADAASNPEKEAAPLPEPPSEEVLAEVARLKGDGNGLFQSGQYEEAAKEYTSALEVLHHEVKERAVLLSNRAACHQKLVGDNSPVLMVTGPNRRLHQGLQRRPQNRPLLHKMPTPSCSSL